MATWRSSAETAGCKQSSAGSVSRVPGLPGRASDQTWQGTSGSSAEPADEEVGHLGLAAHRHQPAPAGIRCRLHPAGLRGDLGELALGEAVDRAPLDDEDRSRQQGPGGLGRPLNLRPVCLEVAGGVINANPECGHGYDERRRDEPTNRERPRHGKYWCASGRICAQFGMTASWPAIRPSEVHGGTSTTPRTPAPSQTWPTPMSRLILLSPTPVLISPLKTPARVGRPATFRCESCALTPRTTCFCGSAR